MAEGNRYTRMKQKYDLIKYRKYFLIFIKIVTAIHYNVILSEN